MKATVISSANYWTHRKPSVETRPRHFALPLDLSINKQPNGGANTKVTMNLGSSSSSLTQSTTSPNSSSSESSRADDLMGSNSSSSIKNSKSAPVSPKRRMTHGSALGMSTSMIKIAPPVPPPFSLAAFPARIASTSSITLPSHKTSPGPIRVHKGTTLTSMPKYIEITSAQMECPTCHAKETTVPMGYWKERSELVLMCSSLFVDTRLREGYRICGNKWTLSERVAVCECGGVLEIEYHYRNFFYMCPGCHSMSHTSRKGDPPSVSNNDMS
jgi:Zn finger protein HypA/HybF involved in hydrogenase expression